MGAYEYQALDAAGKAQRGVLQGDTPKAVRAALRERGLTPLELSEVKEKRSATSGRAPVFQRAMSGAQLAILTRQFATLVRAGLPLDEVLSALAEQSENESAKRMLVAVRARMMEGSTLASISCPSYGETATLQTSAAGSVTVQLTVTDSAGASSSNSLTLTVLPAPGSGGGGALSAPWLALLALAVAALSPGRRRRLN